MARQFFHFTSPGFWFVHLLALSYWAYGFSQNKAGSLTLLICAGIYLFSLLSAFIPWHGLGQRLNTGIRDYFQKAFVYVVYVSFTLQILYGLGLSSWVLIPLFIGLLPVVVVDCILLYFYGFIDHSPLPINWFSHGHDRNSQSQNRSKLEFSFTHRRL
ncbi:MAG: hypothetical protein HYU97_09590 [Deltaproteobacteria bacterium]|nr:hypothetical protein [Deltaproteobacteria bacterium]